MKKLLCIVFLLFIVSYASVKAESKPIIRDDADLLTAEEKINLLQKMLLVCEYGTPVFWTTYEYGDARQLSREFCEQQMLTDTSWTLFMINMRTKQISIYSEGDIYQHLSGDVAYRITENTYTLAGDERYYECACSVFDQMIDVLKVDKAGEENNKPEENDQQSKLTEKVVGLEYEFVLNNIEYTGIYSGMVEDGVPEGYGVFDNEMWHYLGEWSKGFPTNNGKYYFAEDGRSSLSTKMPNEVATGDIIKFGHYEQNNDITDGQEDIEWLVLDVKDDRALLLSLYGLDTRPYNQQLIDITWSNCSLRRWLNDEFIRAAFTDKEKIDIILSSVDNGPDQGYSGWGKSGGSNTQDRMFLLSYAEACKYFNVSYLSENMMARMTPTEYAIQLGAYISEGNYTEDGSAVAYWWLRSPGTLQDNAALVYGDGSLYRGRVDASIVCVRPAFWMKLN